MRFPTNKIFTIILLLILFVSCASNQKKDSWEDYSQDELDDYLTDDYLEAEKFLKRAVELMTDDPVVNDHYGDILWKLNRKIQARYFWSNVLKMDDAEENIIKKINIKMIQGLKS